MKDYFEEDCLEEEFIEEQLEDDELQPWEAAFERGHRRGFDNE